MGSNIRFKNSSKNLKKDRKKKSNSKRKPSGSGRGKRIKFNKSENADTNKKTPMEHQDTKKIVEAKNSPDGGEGIDYIYDFNTSNETFLGVYNVLKEMGISNNKFFLLLYDQDLVNVNPRDPNLSIDTQHKVVREVKRNFWYYIREVVRLETEAGLSKFMLHIGNLSAMYLKLLNLNYYWEQPRQTGKTLGEMASESYFFGFGCSNTNFGFYNYEQNRAVENLQTMISVLQNLPNYLQIFKLKETTDEDGNKVYKERSQVGKKIRSFDNPVLGNKVITQTAGQTKAKADKVGRGATQAKINMDEIGYYKFNKRVWASANYAHTTAARNAERAGKPYGVSWTSTPPEMGTERGQWLYEFVKEKSAKFEPFMFDMTRVELTSWLKKNAKKDFFYITYQYHELGYDEEWAAKQLRQCSTKSDFKKDILLEWIRDYSSNPYSQIALDKIKSYTQETDYESIVINGRYHFKLYPGFDLAKYKKVIIGVDVGQGMGGDYDYSTMVGIDPDTTEVVFSMRTNEADTNLFSQIILKFIEKYLDRCLIIIERNGVGKSVIDNIKKTKYKRFLYYSPFSDRHKVEGANPEVTTRQGIKCLFGLINRKKIRDELFEMLGTRIKHHKKLFKCQDIHREITNLIDTGRRIDHRDGTHDDLLMAYLFALYVALRDDDLEMRFGIPKPNPPTDDGVEERETIDKYKEEEDDFDGELLNGMMGVEEHGVKTSNDVLREMEEQDYSKRLKEKGQARDEEDKVDITRDIDPDDLFRF